MEDILKTLSHEELRFLLGPLYLIQYQLAEQYYDHKSSKSKIELYRQAWPSQVTPAAYLNVPKFTCL